ncbi:hypothetical protein F5883DRAFT_24097 [Diaporthe sp. PMI_573]|nr:hypothetical protein F5883DRAFT_24097 [Diaporthaceae sp. PMI_573]
MDISCSTVEELAVECMDMLKLCSTQGDETLRVRFQNRVVDFKLWCDGVGALARMHAKLDWRFRERTDDLTVIKGILALFRRFLETYRRSTESCQPVDEPLRNIDSILEDLALLALAIRQTGRRSRLEKADSKYKLGDHDDLWVHLQCLLFIRRDPAGLGARVPGGASS